METAQISTQEAKMDLTLKGEDRLLTTNEAAEVLTISAQTLKTARTNSTKMKGHEVSRDLRGLKYIKLGGSVRYRYGDLLEFLREQTKGR